MTGPQVLAYRELVREIPIAVARAGSGLAHRARHPSAVGARARAWRAASSATARARAARRPSSSAPRCAHCREGRFNVSVDDLRAIALPALRHRLILNFEGEAEGVDVDRLITQLIEAAETMSGAQKEVFLR